MSEKELEERVMLTKMQYLEIENYIQDNFPHALIIHQKNRYFDDDKRTIKQLSNVLRIRSFRKNNKRELTYKVKGDNGDEEYNQTLSHYWFYQITRFSRLPDGPIKEKLLKDGVDVSSLKMIADLYTRRIEINIDDYLLVLDANLYNDITDYNLEIESNVSKEHAKRTILDYCQRFNIKYELDYLTKSERAMNSTKK